MKNDGTDSANNAAEETSVLSSYEYNDDLRERWEKEKGMKIITHAMLVDYGFKDLQYWLKSIAPYGNVDHSMLIFYDEDDHRVSVNFYTSDNKYNISTRRPHVVDNKMDHGYLGCTVSDRKPRPGEDWTRGSDLPDGPYSDSTWKNIVNRIIKYEMKWLKCWR